MNILSRKIQLFWKGNLFAIVRTSFVAFWGCSGCILLIKTHILIKNDLYFDQYVGEKVKVDT